jgi:N-acetyl-S-(2-succino)cysteine monooxygenase
MTSKKQIVLSALVHPHGIYKGAWRHPDAEADRVNDVEYYKEVAQLCERGLLDLFFIADTPAARTDNLDIWTRSPLFQNVMEPVTLLAALAGATSRIGLGATVSTSFFEPYNIARQFASLDHITGGRAAWNVVTSANDYAARNFGLDRLPPHGERYAKARECLELVKSYWDTWDQDAFVFDKEKAIYFDSKKFHTVDHKGAYFTVHGGLNIARPPQGHPVIIQAGASESGKELAAQTAEIVFGTGAEPEAAKAFYSDLKGRMPKFGRDESQLFILSGLSTVIGRTREEAKEKFEYLQSLVPVEVKVMALSNDLEVNLLDLPLDEPVPVDRIPASSNLHQAYFNQIADMIRGQKLTLREMANKYTRGSKAMCATANEVADFMESWIEQRCCDGFMLSPAVVPGSLKEFIDEVVPVLQERGIYKTAYKGKTLRENLGLYPVANKNSL